MKKTMIVAALMALVATGANAKKAADSAEVAKNKPVSVSYTHLRAHET